MRARKNLLNQQNRMCDLLRLAIEYLVQNGRFGEWEDTRTSATAIWALSLCGIQRKRHHYVFRALSKMFDSTECNTDPAGCCFNYEAWDTSLTLLALATAEIEDFQPQVSRIQQWLRAEFFLDSVRDEPWETLWTLLALLRSDRLSKQFSAQCIRSVHWLLAKRNAEGVLISAHYVGLLLAVLNLTTERLNLSNKDKSTFENACKTGFEYLISEFDLSLEDDRLWRDEPWQIGHILFGLSKCRGFANALYSDFSFNEELEAGLRALWNEKTGFGDIVDTAGLTVGLANYLFERSEYLAGGKPISGLIHRGNFHTIVSFHREFIGTIPKVFVSHSSIDKNIATQVVELLKKRGVKVWFDQNDVLVGHSVVDKVYEGIRDSDYLAIILTNNSVNSKWVKEELNAAKMKEIETTEVVILPLLFEECQIPLTLRDKHYANFTRDFDSGTRELIQQLFPSNIYSPTGPKNYEKCTPPPEHKRCHFCGSAHVTGALIDATSDEADPNILCEDCGNWW